MTAAETINAVAAELGITLASEFVPWSESPRKAEKDPSLNWTITLAKDGRPFLTTAYSAGMGHCPSYPNTYHGRLTIRERDLIRYECEHGRAAAETGGVIVNRNAAPILPALADVLSCLVSDADALDRPTFEDWSADLGYDGDSRKAEEIYRACLETGLKLRAALGEDGLRRLRAACADY